MSYQKHPVVIQRLAGYFLEAQQQIGHFESFPLYSGYVHYHAARVHHYGAVAKLQSGLHVVCHHKAGEAVFLYYGGSQRQYL